MMQKATERVLAESFIISSAENEFMPGDIHDLRRHRHHDLAGSLTGMKKCSEAFQCQRDLL